MVVNYASLPCDDFRYTTLHYKQNTEQLTICFESIFCASHRVTWMLINFNTVKSFPENKFMFLLFVFVFFELRYKIDITMFMKQHACEKQKGMGL